MEHYMKVGTADSVAAFGSFPRSTPREGRLPLLRWLLAGRMLEQPGSFVQLQLPVEQVRYGHRPDCSSILPVDLNAI